ncbi:MAG: DUF4255 domain-containing protein [Bacteroidetes bacterium]|nr:DUF4255 domain-containing protein [Bacteroidota bacterium]
MIYESLSCVTDEINEYFRGKLKIYEQKIVLSGLVNQDGTIAIQGENKIVVTLVNLEKETAKNLSQKGAMTMINSTPVLNINLYVLFSAYFTNSNYAEALRFLSFIIGYFQVKNVFNRANTPTLDDRIDKLTFEIVDMSTDAVSNMWSSLGAKYMPSVLYKVRMLTFDEAVVREFRPLITSASDENQIK